MISHNELNGRIATRKAELPIVQGPISLESQRLYVVGGEQRTPRALLDQEPQWYDYQKGVILTVDPVVQTVERCLEYISPAEVRADDSPVLFKCGTLNGETLYLCTQTELLIYRVPDFQQLTHISLPCFNDVHHLCPTPAGTLLVAISGLDMVVEINMQGQILREWDVYDGNAWSRFSKATDYRLGISTKPHRSHPNNVFMMGDEIWVTRFEQRDALCLNRPNRRIEIGYERVHDGYFHEGLLYFTTVNGLVVVANPATLQIEEVIDLSSLHDAEVLLGWCRGIFVEGTKAWVGFSRIRPTKFREAVSWVRSAFKQSLQTHIACYDLVEKRCLAEIMLEDYGLNAVFSIFPIHQST